jgi:His/Glu/Gln/Arg/opine family amino acid ABC transporter permease subunit
MAEGGQVTVALSRWIRRGGFENRRDWLDATVALVVVVGGFYYTAQAILGGRNVNLDFIQANAWTFLGRMQFNLYVTTVAFAIGLPIGFLVGWARTAHTPRLPEVRRDLAMAAEQRTEKGLAADLGQAFMALRMGAKYFVRRIADGYVEIIRGTPILIQLFFLWFTLVVLGLLLNPVIAGILGLAINTGGYQGEIFRGGLQTVHSGQVEAAKGLGFSRLGTMRYVVLPQALRLTIPPLTNEFIGLLKVSVILIILGVPLDIFFLAREMAFRGHVFEIFIVVAGIFFLITIPVSRGVQLMERRFRIPGLGIQQVRTREGT